MEADTSGIKDNQAGTQTKKNQDQDEGKSELRTSRRERGLEIVRRNVLWALGAGVVPIPGLDVLAVMAVELKMLRQLSQLYEVKFSEDLAKKLTGSLLTGLGSVGIGSAVGSSFIKMIPVLGTTLGLVTVPALAAALTHAMGKVFILHFEIGGTLLNFEPEAVRTYFKQEFEQSKGEVPHLRRES